MNKRSRAEATETIKYVGEYKKMKLDETLIKNYNSKQNVDYIKNNNKILHTTDKILSVVKSLKSSVTQPSKPINTKTEHKPIGSNYIENRLHSMSHIKLINPKYRNIIIPVLPGAINKF
jgi:hypothetical protein